MKEATVEYLPRDQFQPFHRRTQRWAIIVARRRAGKTVATINDLIWRVSSGRFCAQQLAVSGNPGGRSHTDKLFTDAIRVAALTVDPATKKRKLRLIAEKLVDVAHRRAGKTRLF